MEQGNYKNYYLVGRGWWFLQKTLPHWGKCYMLLLPAGPINTLRMRDMKAAWRLALYLYYMLNPPHLIINLKWFQDTSFSPSVLAVYTAHDLR